MAKGGKKQFQSGREVLEAYIPGYIAPEDLQGSRGSGDATEAGRDIARRILQRLDQQLRATKLGRQKSGGGK